MQVHRKIILHLLNLLLRMQDSLVEFFYYYFTTPYVIANYGK